MILATPAEVSFNEIKDAISTAPMLLFPENYSVLILDTDASLTAVGAVPCQIKKDGKVLPYASNCLTKEESKYCTTRRELLAVVMYFNFFHPYLLSHHQSIT